MNRKLAIASLFGFVIASVSSVANAADIQIKVAIAQNSSQGCADVKFVDQGSVRAYLKRLLIEKGHNVVERDPKNRFTLNADVHTCGYVLNNGTTVGSFAVTVAALSSGKSDVSNVAEVVYGWNVYSGTFSGERQFVSKNIVSGIDNSLAKAVKTQF